MLRVNLFYIENKAVVKNLKACTMCRECIRNENGFADKVELGKERDHYICILLKFSYCGKCGTDEIN